MKTNWFGLFPVHQLPNIYKKRKKVEQINKSSDLNKDNDKDTYEIRRENEKGR
tara:strand:- start:1728 stop:1886 length:159 start_codon:yes stop_codon:yes gene_type:complete